MNDIELNLFAYTDKIQRGSLLNLHDEKVKAEDFFFDCPFSVIIL